MNINILHISDIHLKSIEDSNIYGTQLASDLRNNLNIDKLDYLVITGDIADKSQEIEYHAASLLIEKLNKLFNLDYQKIIIVPGNHDMCWNISQQAYKDNKFNEDTHKRRFENFNIHFYYRIKAIKYPLNYEEQAQLFEYPNDKILFLALNSNWQIDHLEENRKKASINMQALSHALDDIILGDFKDWLKIAIFHHPVDGLEMMNSEFMQLLAENGFKLCMHGHVHRANSLDFKYIYRRKINVVGAGTFGASANEQVIGIPLQYNLLLFNKEDHIITVETRKKEDKNGSWSPDARWDNPDAPGNLLSRYILHLNNNQKNNNDLIDHLSRIPLSIEKAEEKPNLKQEFIEASKGLLSWPRTLKYGDEIERNEFNVLSDKIEQLETSTTLVLGSPGTGKSSLLAALAQHFVNKGNIVLGIKADMLAATIDSPEKLTGWLNLSMDVRTAIKSLSVDETVIVFIDQLDALSELLDRKSERLNVLLNLIHHISGMNKIHIIATSREFEYRHDVRLTSIDAERLNLQLPTWDDITLILKNIGYNTDNFSGSFKEILRVPLHLKIYLDIAEPGNISFTSLQTLLEKLWERNILNSDGSDKKISLLEKLANKMADDETLWLPVAMCDDFIKESQYLEQSDILSRGSNNLLIGFRHQTYYDYTLARAFARGTKILSDYIIERQDGLFIRPILLSSLNYIRESYRDEYHRQLTKLLQPHLRIHLKILILEFIGEQKDPDDFESNIMLPLLNSEKEGPRIFSSVADSPGWFWRIYLSESLESWMKKSNTLAAHCVALLTSSINIATDEVLNLIRNNWVNNEEYDNLSINVLSNLQNWNSYATDIILQITSRSFTWALETIVEKLIEIDPDSAFAIIHMDLDRRFNEALEKVNTDGKNLELPEENYLIHYILHKQFEPIEKIIENQNCWYNIESYAETYPKFFIKWVFPWFIKLIETISDQKHPFVIKYRYDSVTSNRIEEDNDKPIVRAAFSAAKKLAEIYPEEFKTFVKQYESLDLLVVHRIITRGLVHIASLDSKFAIEYLLCDPRRFVVGDATDNQYDTKSLISIIYPYIDEDDKSKFDTALVNFKAYKKELPEWSPEDRLMRQKWERQDRLRLLRVIPDQYLSVNMKRLKHEEERALPDTDDGERECLVGSIGSRMLSGEMKKASDENILNLFNKLPDQTGYDSPYRKYDKNYARAGGAIQLSHEFSEFAKSNPERTIDLIVKLKSCEHEIYASRGLEALAETDFPTDKLVVLITDLYYKGFKSAEFFEGAANALKKCAEKDNGLSDELILLLTEWMNNCDEPLISQVDYSTDYSNKDNSILFDHTITFAIPGGRGSIISAIIFGYLKRNPKEIKKLMQVIEDRYNKEVHPAVWALTLTYIPCIFNFNREHATQVYSKVIKLHPDIIKYKNTIFSIAKVISLCIPKESVKEWLEILLNSDLSFCRQAYGELLLIYYINHNDEWVIAQVNKHINELNDEYLLLGLSYSAINAWENAKCQQLATDIICQLTSYDSEPIRIALSSFFKKNQNIGNLNSSLHKIINAICDNELLFMKCVNDIVEFLIDYTGREPEFVAYICNTILKVAGNKLNDYSSSLVLSAEHLTNIALTLHRQPEYRDVGLKIFEDLLSLKVRETQAALEVLDRKPSKKISVLPSRPRRRRKRKNRANNIG